MIHYTSLYEILQVAESASIEEIKTAFRKLALIYHPDKAGNQPENEAQFILIHNAYTILCDPERRKEYDAYLRTSNVLQEQRKKTRSPIPRKKTVLPEVANSPYHSLEAVFSHINFVLWEIEDLLRRKDRVIDWKAGYGGKPLLYYILSILVFIDKWILNPAGYPDYFLDARKLAKVDIEESVFSCFNEGKSAHRPFVSITDYFYNVRKRMDKFLNQAHLRDLVKPIPGYEIRLIDCVFEAENLAVHYLSGLNQVFTGEVTGIRPFQYSNPCFNG